MKNDDVPEFLVGLPEGINHVYIYIYRERDVYIHVVIPMYNLIDNSNNYSKTLRSLWQCYKGNPNVNKQNMNHSNTRLI